MSFTVNRLILLTFLSFFISPITFSCEIEKGHVATLYSSSCSINTASSRNIKPIFLQFKFSGKSFSNIVNELESVQKKFNVGVAAHKIAKGHRLLLGPIEPQKVSYFIQQLESLGYSGILLRTVPQGRLVASRTSTPAIDNASFSVASISPENTFVKVLGEVSERKLLAIMNSEAQLIKTTYPAALARCTTLGSAARIANQNEYIALLSSEQALLIFGNELMTPFWLNEQWVVTRLETQVQKRKVSAGVPYSVVCSIGE